MHVQRLAGPTFSSLFQYLLVSPARQLESEQECEGQPPQERSMRAGERIRSVRGGERAGGGGRGLQGAAEGEDWAATLARGAASKHLHGGTVSE